MLYDLKKNDDGSVTPNIPSPMDILGRVAGKGWEGFNSPAAIPEPSEKEKAAYELSRSYMRVFTGQASVAECDRVLEDLFDQTLRRGPSMAQTARGSTPLNFEQMALFNQERTGQNGVVLYIMQRIKQGRELPAAVAIKKSRKK